MLRAALLAAWLAAAASTWWSAPRQATYDDARAAIAEKRLTVYQWGDSWDSNDARPWFGGATLRSTDTQGPIFAWRTSDSRVHWADTEDFGEVTLTGAVDEKNYSGTGAAGIAQDLTAAGLQDRAATVGTRNPWVAGAGVVAALVTLAVLVAGPAPVLGTRWYWFWLTTTVPYGLGLVFWLFRDRPWSRTARAARRADGGQRRDRGWLGLLAGILLSLLIGVVVSVLHSLLGDQWVPPAQA
ncbi:hypothetical protein Areg01_33660 [Actinoplanes regularis]|nr:hypothetical protein Areg01_33660 [Actinoplanes regularis]